MGGAALGSALGGGIALGSLAVSFSTLASIGVLGLSIGYTPNLPGLDQTGANARGTSYVNPDAVGAYVFGRTTVPSALIFEEVHGDDDSEISNVLAHAWHRIESYQGLYVEGEGVSFSGDAAIGDYAGILTWTRKTGAPGQVAIAIADTGWPATTPVFEGVAHSSMTWDFKNQDKLRSGVPTHLDVIVEGAWLYDPREDASVGGAGSHDLEDPTTWGFNDGNAALVLLRALIGEYSSTGPILWGRGVGYADINMDSFTAMANVADEVVDGKPRYRLGGMWLLDGGFDAFVQRWEAETGGKLSKSGGAYTCWLPHDDLTPLTTITQSDLLPKVGVKHAIAGDIGSLFNCARGRYIEPDDGYRGFPFPPVAEDTAIAEDGLRREMYVEYSWVQDVEIAERTTRGKVRRTRFQRTWTIAMGWEGQGPSYAPFTVHTLNIPETGNDDQIVRVVERIDGFGGATILVLQQEDVSIYDDTVPLGDPHASNTIPNRLDRIGAVTPRYIDGTSIDDAPPTVSASLTTDNGTIWRRAADGVTWAPVATTSDLTFTFRFAGNPIATHVIRVTRSGENLSAVTQSESGDPTTESISGDGTPRVTVQVTHDNSGVTAIQTAVTVTSGADGADGGDGDDGISVHVSNIYRRSATPPSTPTGGSYNFTTRTLTPPASWSAAPPAGTDPLYASTASWSIVGQDGTDSSTTWTAPAIIVQDGTDGADGSDGADGDDGLSVHVANVYRRSASAPATPTGGSYNFTNQTLTPPTNWFASPPAGSTPLYVSTASFAVSGPTGTDSSTTWTTPALLVQDGADGTDGSDGADGADGPPGVPGLPGVNTLNADPYFQQPDQHWYSTGAWTTSAEDEASFSFPTITDGKVGRRVLRYAGSDSDSLFSEEIPIDPDETYRVSVWARETANNPNNYLLVAFVDGDGANIVASSSSATGWTAKGTYHYWDISNAEFNGAWTRYEFVFGPDADADGTIPSGAVGCRIGSLVNLGNEASCGVELAEYKLETTLSTVMIRGGAVTADKVSVAQLSAISADLGVITAGTIVLPPGGHVRSGQTAFDTGTGFFIGNVGGTPQLSIGNAAGNKFTWDGSTLSVLGNLQWGAPSTFTPTWTGFGTAPSGTVSYFDMGSFAFIFFPSAREATSNSTAMTWSAGSIPASIRPSGTAINVTIGRDNGLIQIAVASLFSTGAAQFNRVTSLGSPLGIWTASGTKGFPAGTAWFYAK